MVRAPSLAGDVASARRISLVRAGEGPDATWLAEVEGLPNSSARGATPEEAVRRAWAAADGMRRQAHAGEAEGDEGQPSRGPRHSGKLLVRMPATLHDELARAAESEGVSLNQLITGVLASAVEWRTSDEQARERGKARVTRRASAGSEAPAGDGFSMGLTRIALAANFAVVLVAAIVAITLLVMAWPNGW